MAAVTGGADLVRRLRESGTGEDKLAVARAVLAEKGAASTSGDVLAALEARFPGTLTVAKARAYCETGEWVPDSARPLANLEDQILAGPADLGKPEPPKPSDPPKPAAGDGRKPNPPRA